MNQSGASLRIADLLAKAGQATGTSDAAANPEQSKAAPISLSPAAIARTPAQYYGRRVEVGGEIEDVFSNNVFTLDEDALFAGPDVLVITRRPATAVSDGADIRVTGTLRRFSWTEVRDDFDWLELDRDLVVSLENRRVLVADSVARAYGAD